MQSVDIDGMELIFVRATLMYGPGDVRVENVPDPTLQQPTDALVRVVRACVCGSDLHPYHSMPPSGEGSPMGHEFIGVVEETGLAAGVLNHPAAGVAWLANKIAAYDEQLNAADVVLAGSFTRPTVARAGDSFHVDYGPLGSVAFRLV